MKWIAVALALISLPAPASEPTLTIAAEAQHLEFTRSQLLSRSDLQSLVITDSVYRERLRQFKAIPLAHLFEGLAISDRAVVQFKSTDGFSAILDKRRLLSTDPKASTAYLAIEDPKSPWPNLTGETHSAGPFYLVWTNPHASAIGPEEWPYQIASFEILSDPRTVLPNAYPAAEAPASVQQGFKVFQKNCLACHKMNGDGDGSIGPDLNLPMNPTEYFAAQALASLIRNPASVRTWPRSAMPGFSEKALSDAELADLTAYLKYMSTRKARH